MLTRFIRRHWSNQDHVGELRQDVYERVLKGASVNLPANARAYMFATARNHLINKARRASVVSIELVAQVEQLEPDADWLTPERHVQGRFALRRVQEGLDRLPPRCREVLILRKLEGLSTREVASRLGIGIDAVHQQTMLGIRALTDFMLGGEGRIERPVRKSSKLTKDVS